jgi:hypothetical protein
VTGTAGVRFTIRLHRDEGPVWDLRGKIAASEGQAVVRTSTSPLIHHGGGCFADRLKRPTTLSLTAERDRAHYEGSQATANLLILNGEGRISGDVRSSAVDGLAGSVSSVAHPNPSSLRGNLRWRTLTSEYHADILTALGIATDGRTAWFAGVDRVGRPFVAYVEDNGNPGRNDRFRLWIDGQPQTAAGGVIVAGNVQVKGG